MINGQIPVLLAALQELIMGSTLVKCAATDVGIQWAGWALASALRTEKFYDLAGKSAHRLLTHARLYVLYCCLAKIIRVYLLAF